MSVFYLNVPICHPPPPPKHKVCHRHSFYRYCRRACNLPEQNINNKNILFPQNFPVFCCLRATKSLAYTVHAHTSYIFNLFLSNSHCTCADVFQQCPNKMAACCQQLLNNSGLCLLLLERHIFLCTEVAVVNIVFNLT